MPTRRRKWSNGSSATDGRLLSGNLRAVWQVVALVAVFAFAVPAAANASWGKKCSDESGLYHCYAIAEWKTSEGSSEEVRGLSSEIQTREMQVPAWYDGDFVSNEQWMAQPGDKWVEDGQIAGVDSPSEEGLEVNGKSLHWFYAYNNGSWGEYVAPWTYPGWIWQTYTLEDREANGHWCEKINLVWVSCQAGFHTYATKVAVGMEAADEIQPRNRGMDRTGTESKSGEWHEWPWGAVWVMQNNLNESEFGVTCVQGYEPPSGDVIFGTPASECSA